MRRRARALVALLGLAALALGAQPAWLHAKAILAQALLQHAWHARQAGVAASPWPGADTRPVARLQVPAHGVDHIVLAGDNGRTLAFGPGWAEGSAAPGQPGRTVISAHRDTHFAFLRRVGPGDAVLLQAGDGETRSYRVVSTGVVDSRTSRLAMGGEELLVLVTCWPFDALSAGGPLRYVVTAQPVVPTSPGGGPARGQALRTRERATSARIRSITPA